MKGKSKRPLLGVLFIFLLGFVAGFLAEGRREAWRHTSDNPGLNSYNCQVRVENQTTKDVRVLFTSNKDPGRLGDPQTLKPQEKRMLTFFKGECEGLVGYPRGETLVTLSILDANTHANVLSVPLLNMNNGQVSPIVVQ